MASTMFHLNDGGSSEAVRTLVGSLAAHLDSSNQLLDFSKFGDRFRLVVIGIVTGSGSVAFWEASCRAEVIVSCR